MDTLSLGLYFKNLDLIILTTISENFSPLSLILAGILEASRPRDKLETYLSNINTLGTPIKIQRINEGQ